MPPRPPPVRLARRARAVSLLLACLPVPALAQAGSPERREAYGGPERPDPRARPTASIGDWGAFDAQAAGWGPVARTAQAR